MWWPWRKKTKPIEEEPDEVPIVTSEQKVLALTLPDDGNPLVKCAVGTMTILTTKAECEGKQHRYNARHPKSAEPLTEYPLQDMVLIPKSRHPKFINHQTMCDSYINGPRGGRYFMNTKRQLFRCL